MLPLCFAEYALLTSRLWMGILLGVKSLSDVTVAPVVPTFVSTHCSQNELHTAPHHCLAPTDSSLTRSSVLLFLLRRIWHFKLWANDTKNSSVCQGLSSMQKTQNSFSTFWQIVHPLLKNFPEIRKKLLDRRYFRCYNVRRGDEVHPIPMGL